MTADSREREADGDFSISGTDVNRVNILIGIAFAYFFQPCMYARPNVYCGGGRVATGDGDGDAAPRHAADT